MKLSELGEFGLIELLNSIINKSKNPHAASWQHSLIGIGDDAAVWQGDKSVQLATTDTLVEGVHFNLSVTDWEKLGWKSLAVNLSDIAAMGGIPKYALTSLALPAELEADHISNLYQGMTQLANEFGVAIVGGDIVTAPNIVINVTIFGSLKGNVRSPLTRSAAKPGDQVAVTGCLGSSAAGLKMLRQKLGLDLETTTLLKQAHLQPMPRVNEGQILLQQGVRAAIDISDGLIADMTQICKASHVGAEIKLARVPIHPAVQSNFKADCFQLALTGGEDYELLFTGSKKVIEQIQQILTCKVTVIGKITTENVGLVSLIDATGNIVSSQQRGWEHFRSQALDMKR